MTDVENKRITAICEAAGVKDIDDLSDGYHTFRQLYYQRMMLFAVIVKQNKDKAWKSLRHEDGELCFNGGWFIVGIDTPEGSYTYHYEDDYWSLFDCVELERSKHWDGHTENDVTRLLSLQDAPNTSVGDMISRQAALRDLIDRRLAIDAIGERPVVWNEWTDEYELGMRNQYDSDKLAIETVPSAQPDWTFDDDTKQITFVVPIDVYNATQTIFISPGYEGEAGLRGKVFSAQPEIIVRCKDCKHYDGRPCGNVDWYNTADDFCSKAERGRRKARKHDKRECD